MKNFQVKILWGILDLREEDHKGKVLDFLVNCGIINLKYALSMVNLIMKPFYKNVNF